MDQKILEKEIVQFIDDLKEYQKVMRVIWTGRRGYPDYEKIESLKTAKEIPLRERLTENFGKLERYFKKIGISMEASASGRSFPIFDTALGEDDILKGESLQAALQMTIKALGIIKSFNNKEFGKIEKKTPIVFVSYNFGEKNKDITKKIKDFISKFDVAISEGSEVDTISVSEKVKTKIDNADIVVAIMTKDEQDDKGVWSPSKWIIEELAYALANKNKEIIRLIENDCITDGRIFGDREYISFDRENLTDALIKLVEVLNKKVV